MKNKELIDALEQKCKALEDLCKKKDEMIELYRMMAMAFEIKNQKILELAKTLTEKMVQE